MDHVQDAIDRWWQTADPIDRTLLLDAARNDLIVKKRVRDTLDAYLLDESGRLTTTARLAVDSVDDDLQHGG